MKNRIVSLVSLLLCCALLCACGGKQAETVYLPEARESAAPSQNPTAPVQATAAPMSESDQRALIDRNRALWAWPEPSYEDWYYAYTDLDQNGRMEVLTASLQGTGLYTYGECWEVNASFSGLSRCYDNTSEGQAWPDIIVETLSGYHDPATNRRTYVCDDFVRDGAARYYLAPTAFCLHDGQIEIWTVAYMEEAYDASGSSVKSYYNTYGSPISEADFNSASDKAFAGQERVSLRLDWNRVEAQAVQTAAPAYQSAAPIKITKDPTGESLGVGGRTWFIAHAENADTLTWELLSPEGRVCSLNEAMAMNPGLELEALEGDTLALRNVPASLDGWSARARFDGPGGTAYTKQASIEVSNYDNAYGAILAAYYRAYTTGNTNAGYAYENGISEFIGYSGHVGYATMDLDGNGVSELLIAGMGTDDFSDGVLYDLYTLVNGQPVQLACSSARDRYYLLMDSRIYNEGSGGAGHTICVVDRLAGDTLYAEESAYSFFDNGPRDGYYHQTDGYTYEPRSWDQPVSEQEFNQFVDYYRNGIYVPQLTQIA